MAVSLSSISSAFTKIVTNVKSAFNIYNWIASFNFDFGAGTTALAAQQDSVFVQYKAGKAISEATKKSFETNAWFIAAQTLCPGNLVIRNYCLIDLLRNKAANATNILNQMNILTYSNPGTYRIWAEGYSYWLYTKVILNEWITKFPASAATISAIRTKVDNGFIQTSYKRGTIWYPAPFGDLRNEPLNPQVSHTKANITIDVVTFQNIGEGKYTINAKPIKLNLHIPKDNYTVTITGGIPVGFKWYTGWSSKYASKAAETADMLDPKRLATLV